MQIASFSDKIIHFSFIAVFMLVVSCGTKNNGVLINTFFPQDSSYQMNIYRSDAGAMGSTIKKIVIQFKNSKKIENLACLENDFPCRIACNSDEVVLYIIAGALYTVYKQNAKNVSFRVIEKESAFFVDSPDTF